MSLAHFSFKRVNTWAGHSERLQNVYARAIGPQRVYTELNIRLFHTMQVSNSPLDSIGE